MEGSAMSHPAVDRFGRLVVTRLRDAAITHHDLAVKRHWKAPALQNLQSDLAALSPEQRQVVRRCVIDALDTGMHDFLFALQEMHGHGVEILVDGENVAALSDGLHGESFSEDGWIARFGKYPEGTGDPRDST